MAWESSSPVHGFHDHPGQPDGLEVAPGGVLPWLRLSGPRVPFAGRWSCFAAPPALVALLGSSAPRPRPQASAPPGLSCGRVPPVSRRRNSRASSLGPRATLLLAVAGEGVLWGLEY